MFPFKSTILQERSQLQGLNCRLESYLAGVRELERENELLSVEIGRLRQAGASDGNRSQVEEMARTRWEVEELTLERARAEMQRCNLQREMQELGDYLQTEQALHSKRRQELEAHQKTLQQMDATNTSLEGVISQLQGEYRALEAQHQRDKGEMEKVLRRGSQLLVTQRSSPIHLEYHSLAFSEIWQENLEVYRHSIEGLEATGQQDEARREELLRENALLLRDVETLKNELEEQCILQSQLEEDFLTVQQKHGEEVVAYQSQVDVLEDEKQHLAAAIALNLKEQQKLMQVKMGLNLELATYRALLQAEHRTQHEIVEQQWNSSKDVDTRSQRYNIRPLPTLDSLDGIRLMPSRKTVPSTTQTDSVTITRGRTPKAIPSRISTRKIKSSFSDEDLLYTGKSSPVQTLDSPARSRNTHRGMVGLTMAPRAPFSAVKRPQDQRKVLAEEVKTSQVVVERPEQAIQVTSLPATIHAMESVDHNKNATSENHAKPQSSSDLANSFSRVEYYDFNGRSGETAEEEEFKWQSSNNGITFEPGATQLEFKADLSEVGSLMSPDRYSPAADFEQIQPEHYLPDNIAATSDEEPTTESVGESRTKSPAEDSRDYRRITLSKEGVLAGNVRIGDIFETVIKPIDLGEMVSPEAAITYHMEEQEVLEDGTTKRDIIIQSRREDTVDLADEGSLLEVLNKDSSCPEMQLREALGHLSGLETEGFIDGLRNLGFQGRGTTGKVSVNVEINEQMPEAESFPPPPDAGQLYAGEHDPEEPSGKHEEVLNITMSAADFRRTMLSGSEPESTKFLERTTSFSSDENAEEGEGELYGVDEQHANIDGDEGPEHSERAEFAHQDSFSKDLCSPRIIEESIKVPQGVQASIVELLKEETEDPTLKLKGALEHLRGTVPDNLRNELSILTGDIHERSDNMSVNITNVQQSSHRGVITIEAEVNVSQTLEPEDFFSMETYNEDEGDISELGSGLAFHSNQQELQGLLNGKDFPFVGSLNDEDRSRAKVQVFNEQTILFEPSARDEDEDAGEFSSTQGHTGLQTAFEMAGSSEMEGDLPPWLQKGADNMFGEEFAYEVTDPDDSSATLHMNVNRIVSVHSGGGDHEGPVPFITEDDFAEGADGKGPVDNVYYGEWESGSRDELAIEEADPQPSDYEVLQYATLPKVQTKQRVVVSESTTQVIHGQQGNGVTRLDED